jgi:hypothetical protein
VIVSVKRDGEIRTSPLHDYGRHASHLRPFEQLESEFFNC